MKKQIISLCLIATVFATAGCDSAKNSAPSAQLELRLDNGRKWEANPETQTGFEMMRTRLNAFRELNEPVISDYHDLGSELQAMVNEIVNKCTMKGDGHEELHKLLIPVISNIKDLEGSDIAQAENAVDELQQLASLYFDFFEKEKGV